MSATVKTSDTSGFQSFTLENGVLRATVIPSLGGRIWDLVDCERERQWIWHRDDVTLGPAHLGSTYDDVWAGGWEELFPNDAPGAFEGRTLPDHGEWWVKNWHAEHSSERDAARLRLTSETEVVRARCTKEIRLEDRSNTLHISYRIESLEPLPFHFLFKQHLPIAITPQCRLSMPGGRVVAVDPAFGTRVRDATGFDWHAAAAIDDGIDLSRIPSRDSREREFVYVLDPPAGWCGVDDLESGATLRFSFDRERVPFVWLFLSYGGWRDCYTAVLEPCTNFPKDLDEAVARGHAAILRPGEVWETRASVTLGGGKWNE
jgi:hypothetical protein